MNDFFKCLSAILLIAIAVWFFKKSSAEQSLSQDFPDGTYWICLECQHEFNMSLDDVADWVNANPDTKVPCPHCEKHRSVRASKCPLSDCGKLYTGKMVRIDGAVCCPICKKPVP